MPHTTSNARECCPGSFWLCLHACCHQRALAADELQQADRHNPELAPPKHLGEKGSLGRSEEGKMAAEKSQQMPLMGPASSVPRRSEHRRAPNPGLRVTSSEDLKLVQQKNGHFVSLLKLLRPDLYTGHLNSPPMAEVHTRGRTRCARPGQQSSPFSLNQKRLPLFPHVPSSGRNLVFKMLPSLKSTNDRSDIGLLC